MHVVMALVCEFLTCHPLRGRAFRCLVVMASLLHDGASRVDLSFVQTGDMVTFEGLPNAFLSFAG